ncbi:MAG: 4-(cytidine 5'-diphospho)-2-C-methyl-D-erythritol kinase [Stenotrophobium sp.]
MTQINPPNSSSSYANAFAWPAPAKLNLFLHVTGRRSNGYHTLQTLFQIVDFCDRLYFTPRGDGLIRRSGGAVDIPEDADLSVRAAQLLKQASGCDLGADIRIEKNIPLGAGLGGGSSNAATTLVALNHLWNLGFAPDQLTRLGLQLGADVPVFVRGRTAWAEGVGEQLRALPDFPQDWFLVVTPEVQVSTGDIFNAPELRRDAPPVTLEDFNAGRTQNDCEAVTCARYPQVREALSALRRLGPAAMSGTGASVFLNCTSREAAEQARQALPANWRTFIAQGLNQSPLTGIIRAA